MKPDIKMMTDQQIAERRRRGLEARHLQEIEGNPLDAEDIAMFEMFDREGWTDEKCIAYIDAQARILAGRPAPE